MTSFLAVFAIALFAILLVELPDKTLVATLVLSTRYRPRPVLAGVAAAYVGREGVSFAGTFGAIAFAVAGMFLALFPDVMPSSTDVAFSLTTTNAAATSYTLTIMTWVAAIFTPIVLGYQTWTYWVFRKRIGTHHIPTAELASR